MNTLKNLFKTGLLASLLAAASSSCVQDLDRQPFYDVTSVSVYKDPANYKPVLAKLYGMLSVTGQQGPSGKPDLGIIDEGASSYLRQYWMAQELPTDEAVIGWNDGSIKDYHNMNWTSGNEFVRAMYDRIFVLITSSNEFIRETSAERLAERGISGQAAADANVYRAEARFLRAMAYTHALDLFGGNVPFVTEADAVGAFLPKQTNKQALFTYIESELKAIEADLAAPRAGEYGRADKAAVWTLLTKLYLNAQVYTGTARWNDVVTYANKVIAANAYTLEPNYQNLFLADNNNSREIIFPITFDGTRTKTYGGTTFLIHAPVGGKMNKDDFGINGGWAGLRTTKALVAQFEDPSGKTDKRAMFFTDGQNLEINDIATFTEGYAITKYKNVTSTGVKGSDQAGDFVDTDFPLFRLADVYLMYAEAVVRGGTGGDQNTALGYVNQIRKRAGAANVATLTPESILAERARELYWEGTRRTDLIRYGRFTTATYLWPWKGGVKDGRAVEDFRNIYPIPASDRIANPTLTQNPGY